MTADYIAAIDQGTTSTRAIVFDHCGQRRLRRPDRARADLPEGRLGRARRASRSGTTPARSSAARWPRPTSTRATSPRSASPTSARPPSCGTRPPASRSTTPSSGRTPARRRSVDELGRRRRRRPVQGEGRAAAGHLLLRPQGPLDPRQRRGRAREGRGRRPAVRQHRHLGAVEPHRRRRRRRARHRRHQRLAHHADGPATLAWDEDDRRRHGHPAVDAARDPLVVGGVRRRASPACSPACRSRASSATSRRRPSARPASRSARPRTPTAPATSCCSTPARSRSRSRTAC